MGWGEPSKPDPDAQLRRLVTEYLNEMSNPAPDSTYRHSLRVQMGDIVGVDHAADMRALADRRRQEEQRRRR